MLNVAYQKLEERIAEVKALDHMLDLSNWDESTNMKPASAQHRAEVVALTAGLQRRLLVSSEFGELLDAVDVGQLSTMQHANVRLADRTRKQALAIPLDLLMESKRVYSECQTTWEHNRPRNDWANTRPKLEAAVKTTLEIGQCLAEAFDLKPYDALMNQHERGLTQQTINPIFNEIGEFLRVAVPQVEAKQQSPIEFSQSFAIRNQLQLAEQAMHSVGFDFDRGRLDQSAHPFSCGTVNDARITTRLSEDDFNESLFAVLHETGHARYTQNLPEDWYLQFAGEATGMAVHESQSLFMEMQVCRSDEFLSHIHPIIKANLKEDEGDEAWEFDNFKRTVRHVKRDLIRVYADEMTYPLHIILRYDIERRLCEGSLAVKDLPDAWNELMDSLLGVDTRDDFANGCMQDIHWYSGLLGYFPCYLLGAIYAAQLYRASVRKIGDQTEAIRQGNLDGISAWLSEQIHNRGSLFDGQDLISNATGEPLSAEAYLSHLKRRYVDT